MKFPPATPCEFNTGISGPRQALEPPDRPALSSMTSALESTSIPRAHCLHPQSRITADGRTAAVPNLKCQIPFTFQPTSRSLAFSELDFSGQRVEADLEDYQLGANTTMSVPWTSLEIISATYGTSVITSKVHELLTTSQHERFYLIPSNLIFGDPLPGTSKTFTLTWRLLTQYPPSEKSQSAHKKVTNPVTTVGFEDYPLHLPYVDALAPVQHQPFFAISRDFYLLNATFCTVNVTSQIAEMIFWSRSQEVEIPATADALCPGRDPAPELKKSLTVTYARRSSGEIEFAHHCQTAWQGETMILYIGPQPNGSPVRSPTPASGPNGSVPKDHVKKFVVY